ncbi:MAG: hypothetical protein J3K34DRAFT_414799 [Monoraphidium minutum]|nr:MAG: hypothetical protein J3K34DRAFT_414799 [Monoraphidium minutum]
MTVASDGPPAAAGGAAKAGRVSMDGGMNILGMTRSCAANVHPRIRPAMPTLEAIRASPHYPVLVTPDPSQAGNPKYNGSADLTRAMPINGEVVEWENDLWKGKIFIHLKGLSTSDGKIFGGKKRYSWGFAQGVFKRPLKAKDVCVGQEVEVAIRGPSEPLIQWIVTQIAHNFSQTCQVDVKCEHPYFLNPLLAACQLVNVSRPGEEPKDLYEAKEDCRLLHPDLVGKDGEPLPAAQRRKWCDIPSNVEDIMLTPDLVYTFQWWQHLIDLSQYRVHVGPLVAFDLCPFMSAQPMQLFIKHTESNTPLLDMLIWHERLLYPDDAGKWSKKKEAGEEEERSSIGALTDRFKGLLANWRT